MPRPRRQVAYASPANLPQPEDAHRSQPQPSPMRKVNRARRPRESDASTLSVDIDIDDDEPGSPGSPFDGSPRIAKRPAKSLREQAVHNRRSMSGQQLQRINSNSTTTSQHSHSHMSHARRSLSNSGIVQHTPRQVSLRDDSIPSNLQAVGTSLTPASKRPVPILSNFEDWLKLATDNKINATNSWNFALIDYFHEMSLLRDENGKGINFQKASCTLDGCVKIYSSRVESVGVEAGRLLSGLATSNSEEKRKKNGDEEEGSEDEDGDGEDGDGEKKSKKKKQRSHEATLAPSFASLQLKKLELEFAVDPLFKKASADFDEGGAKGLLLNHLSINDEGRIVFDSSDDAADGKIEKSNTDVKVEEEDAEQDLSGEFSQDDIKQYETGEQEVFHNVQEEPIAEDVEIDLAALAAKFFPDMDILDTVDICPSMKNFTLGDPAAALSIPLLQGDNDWKPKNDQGEKRPQIDGDLNLADQSGLFLDGSAGIDFDDDDNLGGFEMGDDVGFGQGGEAWAKEAAVEPMLRPQAADGADDDEDTDGYALSMHHRYQEDAEQDAMFAFFGKAFNSRAKVGTRAFQSLTNWRIAKIQTANEPAPTRVRKEKEPFKIDFHGDRSENLQKLLDQQLANNDKLTLPKSQLKTKGRNLLDKDDEVIDVKAMMRLWTKPKCRVSRRKNGVTIVDEGFGARTKPAEANDKDKDDEEVQGDYDANFFNDDEPLGMLFDGPLPIDDDDDDENEPGFVDAREMLSPGPDDKPPIAQIEQELLPGSFGSQLVTQQGRRLRPEYVNYARTAKKVDVRALKENMWKGMSVRLSVFEEPPTLTDSDGDTDMSDEALPKPGQVLKFTQILGGLKNVYPDQAMKDISTSYGFICLLHLANEKGLVLEGGREEGTMEEILVKRDVNVGEGYEGE